MDQDVGSRSADPDAESATNEAKGWILADWFVRELAPVWVSLAGLDNAVALLNELPPIGSSSDATTARRHLAVAADLLDAVSRAVGGSQSDRDLAADVIVSVIEGLSTFASAAGHFAGTEAGELAERALILSGTAGTTFLVAGIHSAPAPFRNDEELLRHALRVRLQPTVDAVNERMTVIGDRVRELGLEAAPEQGDASAHSQQGRSAESSITDYTFPAENGYLSDVTFRTALIDGRLHGKLIGTHTKWCEYSADDAGRYTDQHVIDVSTDFVDLAASTDLPHRVALIPQSAEIREFFAFPMVRRAVSHWSHDDCPHKPAYDARVKVEQAAARAKVEARAKAPPGVTSYGTRVAPAFDSLEETAVEDGELAARAIDYLYRYGRTRRLPGHQVASKYLETLDRGSEWDDLSLALAMSARADRFIEVARQFGPDAVPGVAGPYCAVFKTELERHLHRLGSGGWPIEDPAGPIAPWLQLFAAIESDAKPSLMQRIFGR